MYFDIEPKSKKDDFFNYRYEFEQIEKALADKEKIIAVIGVRRIGKTSLLNTVFHQLNGHKAWIDGRIVSDPKKEVLAAAYEVATTGKTKIFGKIESLNVSAFGIGLGVKLGSENHAHMEKKIHGAGRVYLFIDEAQRMKRKDLADVLSYFYDRLPHVSFIISGSEIGLMEEVLGENDSEHPLFGRSMVKIVMERLDPNRALEFLHKGFRQAKAEVSSGEANEAIQELDGLVGWLTLYGHEKAVRKEKNALKKTVEIASRIAATELAHFFKKARNKKLYLSILRNTTGLTWEELRHRAGQEAGQTLNSGLFVFALNKLRSYSFIEKKNYRYYLADPLLYKASFLV